VLFAVQRARAARALVPIETQVTVVEEHGLALELRHASALALKDVNRAARGGAGPGERPVNPFLPFDPEMFVADAPGAVVAEDALTSHVLLLNKFPVVEGHVILITRDFREQLDIPSIADFRALAWLMAGLDGLLFFNGGSQAGASQAHKHFQLIPKTPLPIDSAIDRGVALPFRHALVRHEFDAGRGLDSAALGLADAFVTAARSLGFNLRAHELPPCNLLITRRWLMLVPRTREHWVHGDIRVSINALGFAGSLFLRVPEHMQALSGFGVLKALEFVTR
jgi:ATP adenylyltransferase